MRLISQDGKLDIPYERCAVYLRITDEIEIIAYDTENVGFSPWLLGKYSTEEKARTLMGMIRNAYKAEIKCFLFPGDKETG